MTISTSAVPDVPENTLDPAAGLNLALHGLRALAQAIVSTMTATAPPGGPADGECVIIGVGTGAFSGHNQEMARYVSEGAFWEFYAPGTDVVIVVNADDGIYVWSTASSPGEWVAAVGGTSTDHVTLQLSASDLTTDLTTGTTKAYLRSPKAFTLASVRASLLTASSSGNVTVDVNVNGSSILSTKLSIDASEKTSKTAATPAVISSPSISDDDEIEIDIDAAGTGARGLIVTMQGAV